LLCNKNGSFQLVKSSFFVLWHHVVFLLITATRECQSVFVLFSRYTVKIQPTLFHPYSSSFISGTPSASSELAFNYIYIKFGLSKANKDYIYSLFHIFIDKLLKQQEDFNHLIEVMMLKKPK